MSEIMPSKVSPEGSDKTMATAASSAGQPGAEAAEAATMPSAPGAPPPAANKPQAGGQFQGLQAGQMLGKCKIGRELGRGGMGAVYLAQHQTLDVPVAVKILPPEIAASHPQFADRFMREAKLACRIKHANVISVMDAERDEKTGLYYIIQEFVDGGSVRDLMRKGALTEAQALDIIAGVAEALAAAADFQIVHRDIKPENIMLTRKGEVKLADLGIAKERSEEDAGLTMSQVMMGTPAYMAPEQAQDAKNVDARADIYSLGATLYHMLCGAPPFSGETAYALLTKLATQPTPDPRVKRPDISEPVAKLVMRMMSKKPEDRPPNAKTLLAELKACRSPDAASADLQKLAGDLMTEMRAMRANLGTTAAGAPVPAAGPKSRGMLILLSTAAALIVILGIILVMKGSSTGQPPVAGIPAIQPPAPGQAVATTGGVPVVTPPAVPTGVVVPPVPAPDLAALRKTVDELLQKALSPQALADPRVQTMLGNPVRYLSQKTQEFDPALLAKDLVEKKIQIQDVFALLGKPRVGVDLSETVVGKDGIANRESKLDRFRTALRNAMEQKYGLMIVDVTGDRAAQKQQCDILISGNVETSYFGEAVPPAIAAAGGSTVIISYNTAIKVRFLNAVTNQDLDSSVMDFEPKGAEKYCGKSNGI